MKVFLRNQQKALIFNPKAIKSLVKEVITLEGFTCDEVTIYFVNKRKISRLHDLYFNDPTPTDCISFPVDSCLDPSGYQILGEIFVCPEVAIEYAASHAKDPYEETALYIIHGLLHLMGYDDIEEADRAVMRSAEKRHLRVLKRSILEV